MSVVPFAKITESEFQISKKELDKALESYETDGKKFIKVLPFKKNGKSVKFILTGSMFTNGINVMDFNGKKSHSFGFQFDDEKDLAAFSLIEEEVPFTGKDWELKSSVKEEGLFIKLKTIGTKRYIAQSNIKLNCSKPENNEIQRGQNVAIIAEIAFWFNFNESTYGIALSPHRLEWEVDLEEEAPKSRKK